MADPFLQLLNNFRQNYTEYKVTGNTVFKASYEATKAAMDTHLDALKAKADQDGEYIKTTVTQYQQTNPELTRLSSQMKTIQREGPKLQDQYETQEKRNEPAPADSMTVYIKGGLIVGLGLITLLVAVF
jgi:hypothetical protein